MKRKGFTLIELMIVVAIIAIIAAVAIPGLLRSRIGGNEASAIASLKAITTGQEQFKSAVCVDENTNGVGEYGFLEELGGQAPMRGVAGAQQFTANPFIPQVLGTMNALGAETWSSKAGYNVNCHLNDGNAGGLETIGLLGAALAIGPETAYVIYAIPQTHGRSGIRVFAIDSQGMPYAYPNPPAGAGALGATFEGGTPTLPLWNAFYNAVTANNWNDGINTAAWVPAG